MKRIGFVGWRGMVGSVLTERMCAADDFVDIEPVFFSTSQVGQEAPAVGKATPPLQDAHDIETLNELDAIVTTQGGDYTEAVYQQLRRTGWSGYWIDAASTRRMADDSVIVLDPVNKGVVTEALSRGVRTYVGGNCTVSLMLMGIGELLRWDMVEWVAPMTYQAASGSGAQHMRELVAQMGYLHDAAGSGLADGSTSILEIDQRITTALRSAACPTEHFGVPLAGSLIPWIDKPMPDGRSREEWKAEAETNKILGRDDNPVPVDGVCVRIGAMRSHAQALTIKLRRDVPLQDIHDLLARTSQWTRVIANEPEPTKRDLTPTATSGTLDINVGRLRKLRMGGEYLGAFTVGDQLLWGAAEPLRRMLRLVIEHD